MPRYCWNPVAMNGIKQMRGELDSNKVLNGYNFIKTTK